MCDVAQTFYNEVIEIKKVFVILNKKPNVTKSKRFDISVKLQTKQIIKKCRLITLNAFEKVLSKKIATINNVRSCSVIVPIKTKIIETQRFVFFETNIYGFDVNNIDIKYEGFIKENIFYILDKINLLYDNFNSKNKTNIKPNTFSIFRILDSLKIVKADSIEIFSETNLEDFYPEVFEMESVSR